MKRKDDTDEFWGMWKKCKCNECGNTFYSDDLGKWAYKLKVKVKGNYKIVYYCSYTCFRKEQKKRGMRKDND